MRRGPSYCVSQRRSVPSLFFTLTALLRATDKTAFANMIGRQRKILLGFLLFYSVLFIAFFFPALGPQGLLATDDGLKDLYPDFLRGFTLWAQNTGMGYPAASYPENTLWYPANWFFYTLTRWGWGDAWDFYVILTYAFIAFFFHLFLYELFGRHWPALVGALVFSMGSHTMVRSEHLTMLNGILWVPLGLWAVERYRKTLTLAPLAWLSLSLCLEIVSSKIQIGLYGSMAVGLYAFYRAFEPGNRARYVIGISSALVLSILMTCVHLFPVLEHDTYRRAFVSFLHTTENELRFGDLWNLVIPDVYFVLERVAYPNSLSPANIQESRIFFGTLPLFLVIYGLMESGRLSRKHKLFFLGFAVFFILGALGSSTPVAPFLFNAIPTFSSFRCLGRYLILAAIGIGVLAAAGADCLAEGKRPSRAFVAVAVALAFLVPLGFYLHVSAERVWWVLQHPILPRALGFFFVSGFIVVSLAGRFPRRSGASLGLMVLVAGLLVWDVGRFGRWFLRANEGIESAASRLDHIREMSINLRPLNSGWNRTSDLGEGILKTELAFLAGVHSPHYNRFSQGDVLNELYATTLLVEDIMANKRLSPLASLLAVEALVVSIGDQPEAARKIKAWTHVKDADGLRYFRNPVTPSRAWFVPSEDFASQQSRLVETGYSLPKLRAFFDDYARYLTAAPAVPIRRVELVSHRGASWEMRISPGPEGVLVFSERFHPGWNVKVDGNRSPLLKGYGALLAAKVPASAEPLEVTWRFLPASVLWGGGISLVAWLLCVLTIWKFGRVSVPQFSLSRPYLSPVGMNPAESRS